MTSAFLGIEQSATGRVWHARDYDERLATTLAQRFTLPDIIARSLAARGVGLDGAGVFLEPRLRDLLPNPSDFQDMDVATGRTLVAIQNKEKIAIYGDYDVDGATSSALLIRFFRTLGVDVRLYVPDRFAEGYGPNAAAMRTLADEGIDLVICVDCGTTAHAPMVAAKDAGLDVIIIDHHAPESALPIATAVVNPNRLDEDGKYGALAACGVTYLFIIALNRALRASGFYTPEKTEPDLLAFLDLVALGTVCDVVKLTGLNRAFVTQGLRVMAQRRNVGIQALAQVAGSTIGGKSPPDTYLAGFVLGPRVNAGGRVGQSDLGAQLLSTDDPSVAYKLAEHLHQLNAQRRDIEAQILIEAEALAFSENLPIAFVASENWHQGVIGIVASRLKDRFNHPALVVAIEGEVGKGSGRSVGNVDLGAHIIAARQAGLLINGGGHKMAAGFAVERAKIPALRDFLIDRIGKQMAAEPLKPTMMLDGLLASTSLTPDFVRQLATLGPFGTGNSEPRFALADCRIVRADIVGEKHVSVIIMQGGERIKGIAFRATENGLGNLLLNTHGRPVHLAGYLRIDEWQGVERVQFHIGDAAFSVNA